MKRRRVGLLYDQKMCKPPTPDSWPHGPHPENPDRLRVIWNTLEAAGIPQRCVLFKAKEAVDEHILSVHSTFYVNLIKDISSKQFDSWRERIALEPDSICLNEVSSEAAYLAAGSAIEVAEKVAKGDLDSAVAIIRPPGHLAEEGEAIGFCVFNNVAIAASVLLNQKPELGIKKILIVDWDAHHGNGTQKMFWNDPRVLCFSVHREGFIPGTYDDEIGKIGEGPGKGYNINVPWEDGRFGDADYFAVWDHILLPVAREFNPDLIIVSAGFGAAIGDPLGGCSVTPYGYSVMLKKLMNFANGKIVLALEGGYNFDSIANSMLACIKVLLDDNPILGSAEAAPLEYTWHVIQEVRQELEAFWPSLADELPKDLINQKAPPAVVSKILQEVLPDISEPLSKLKVNDTIQGKDMPKRHLNVVIIGGEGSGKSTLAAQIIFRSGLLGDIRNYRDFGQKKVKKVFSLPCCLYDLDPEDFRFPHPFVRDLREPLQPVVPSRIEFVREYFETQSTRYTLLHEPVYERYQEYMNLSVRNTGFLDKAVEVARAHHERDLTRLVIFNAKGPKSYALNTMSGASQADIAVLVISAPTAPTAPETDSETESIIDDSETGSITDFERQIRLEDAPFQIALERCRLSKTLGVSKLLIVVNQMDRYWHEDRSFGSAVSFEKYCEIESRMVPLLESAGYNVKEDVQFLPLSGLHGLNINTRLNEKICSWWTDHCLFEALDAIQIPLGDPKGPFRMTIVHQDVVLLMGKIESGSVSEDDIVMFMPHEVQVDVYHIYNADRELIKHAGPGENITISLSKYRDMPAGSVLSSVESRIPVVNEFLAEIQILELPEEEIPVPHFLLKVILHIHSVVERCTFVKLIEEIDTKTRKRKEDGSSFLKKGAVIKCRVQVDNKICIEKFSDFPQLGRLTLRSEGFTASGEVIELSL